jgi:hypothetical protein
MLTAFVSGKAGLTADVRLEAAEILRRIAPPVFPKREFAISDFGALAGGQELCTRALADAIRARSKAGGGHNRSPDTSRLMKTDPEKPRLRRL